MDPHIQVLQGEEAIEFIKSKIVDEARKSHLVEELHLRGMLKACTLLRDGMTLNQLELDIRRRLKKGSGE